MIYKVQAKLIKKENMNKKKNSKIEHTLIKNILGGSITATVYVFELLINMGILTMEAFLSPSLYKEPSYFSFESSTEGKKRRSKRKKPSDVSIRQSLWRLRKAGFIEKKEKNYFFTEKGKIIANHILKRKKIISKKWDGKYRLVIFDIPEKNKKTRDWLRQELYLIGYKKLQESVLIGRHPLPEDLISSIKQNKIGNFVNYVLADKIYKNIFDK